MSGPDALFRALRRNLAVSTGAALALLVSMAVVLARLPGYLRGRELENQSAVARSVQQKLLAGGDTAGKHLEIAAECIPAYQVGGDYYGVFPARGGDVALFLGDVSGKGLPAALLMAHIHGAIHSLVSFDEGVHLAGATSYLNESISAVTSRERYTSLFWAYYNPREQSLRYVNAGHLSPLLVRRCPTGTFECRRLAQLPHPEPCDLLGSVTCVCVQ